MRKDTPCETGQRIIDLLSFGCKQKWQSQMTPGFILKSKPIHNTEERERIRFMPVKHELTALRTTCLPENCEGTEGRCSVTRHLILHFHKNKKNTEPADFCRISCTGFRDF